MNLLNNILDEQNLIHIIQEYNNEILISIHEKAVHEIHDLFIKNKNDNNKMHKLYEKYIPHLIHKNANNYVSIFETLTQLNFYKS